MPELPEVRTVCRMLRQTVKNKEIKNIEVRLLKMLKNFTQRDIDKIVNGQKIIDISNIGKWIIFYLANEYKLVFHLRLEGKFRNKLNDQNKKHDHVVFNFKDGTNLYFNDTRQFGTLDIIKGNPMKSKPFNKLGKEPQETNLDWLYEKLQRKVVPIKTAMLDQNLVVGLGNIYINEVLWKEKVDPTTPSRKITKKKLKELLKTSHKIMEKSYELGGSTIDSYVSLNKEEGSFQNFLNVHMQKDKPCKRCETKIEKKPVGGRGTYYCPKCQSNNNKL